MDKDVKEKEKDVSLGEKIEDKLDDFMGGLQDAIYGPGGDNENDIPVTYEKPSGIRKINKIQTRRNFNRRLFKNKIIRKIVFAFLIFALIMIIGTFIVELII